MEKDFDKRAMTEAEDKYTFQQSSQICNQCGLIGYLRADMDTDGNGFFSTWNDWRKDLKTDEFKAEFDEVINSLREEGDILHNRKALASYCYSTPQSKMTGEQDNYGIRVDSEKYAYLLRLNPNRGEYNLYCYCYIKDWLNSNLKKAERGIRFIDSRYKELFRIRDGEKIKIHLSGGEILTRSCRFIDEYHVQVGDNIYHIAEFAERMEQNGNTYEPENPILPQHCYSMLAETGAVIILRRGERGYFKPNISVNSREEARALVDEYNGKLGVTRQQEEAMKAGSMFGFHVPAADPKNYDSNGKLIKPDGKSEV